MQTKTCGACQKDLPRTEFYRRGEKGLQARCKTCTSEGHAAYYKGREGIYRSRNKKLVHDLREEVNQFKQSPCTDCKQTYPPYVMDWDHVRGVKRAGLAKLIGDGKRQAALDELAKCELVCANCHRIRTHTRYMSRLAGRTPDCNPGR